MPRRWIPKLAKPGANPVGNMITFAAGSELELESLVANFRLVRALTVCLTVAALGVYVQWNLGFGVPFPLSLIMLPMDLIEWYIRYSISSGVAV